MARKGRLHGEMQSLCGELQADDGVDPKEYFRSSNRNEGRHRKARQLCHQVAEVLNLVLGGELGDELRDVRVVAVVPAPDTAQLMVLVGPAIDQIVLDPHAVLARLRTVADRLRAEVAASITRRRAPRLSFPYVPDDATRE